MAIRSTGLFWILLLLLAVQGATAQPRFDLKTTQTHLPKTVLPSHARLTLDLDPAADTFSGRVRIKVRALQVVPAIVLHARDLQADVATLVAAGTVARTPAGKPARVLPRTLSVQADATTQTWRLVPTDGRPIAAGSWTLDIRYRGQVQKTGEGLYGVNYRVGGAPSRMLATQLEAIQARRLLPVFDEPVFRCVFEVEVRAPQGLQVLSNMPLKRQPVAARSAATSVATSAPDSVGAITRHRFEPTPPMPSYLLAVAVGRFDVLTDQVDGIPLRIFTAPGKREQAQLAMEATRQVLPFYARYFGRPYALPKLDQLAVPGTREGAMEDWGLISYIESALLFDPARSSERTRRVVFELVAHEIAHQWFGNLVSPASWDEIWLNEAFATWMENKAAHHFHPAWQTPLRTRSDLERTMARDATSATRAIRSGPVSEASVFEVFDGITYGKGGAVLSMLEEWLGEATFQRGLAAYMAERAFKPATAGDLWAHIERAAGLQPGLMAAVAASWTDQPGLPSLSIRQRCEAGQTRVTLRQQRFSSQPEALAGGPWHIPLRLLHGSRAQTLLMTGDEQTVSFPGCEPLPLLANAGGRGYYRVDYDAPLRARLASSFTTLAPTDRVALLADSYALASAGRYPMADHLTLLAALPQVKDTSRAALFALALAQWQALDVALAGTVAQEPLRAASWALFGPELERLGWHPTAGEDSEQQTLRADLIRHLARFEHAPTLAAAQVRFDAALAGAASVAPSMRSAVLAAAGRMATEAQFEALLAALHSSERQEERWNLLNALASGGDAQRAQRLLDESLSGRLPGDISSSLPGALGRHGAHAALAYSHLVTHWDAYKRLAGEGPFGGQHWLLPDIVASASNSAVASRLVADQQRLAGAAGASTAARTAAEINNRSRLREREAAALAAALGPVPLSAPAPALGR
jgi:aminopeptidase N